MQNAIINNQISNRKSFKKLLKNLRAVMPVDKKEQLDADTIIERLNLALSFNRPVKLQINCEADSDRVMNFSGTLIQASNGNLLIQSKNDLTRIEAAQIRHLKLGHE